MLGIHHAGIVVSDLDRSIDFYVGILGLELRSEPSPALSGATLEAMLETEGVTLRSVLLSAGDSALELHQFLDVPRRITEPPPPHALGAQHVAFRVADLEREIASIRARGWRMSTPLNRIEHGHVAGLSTVYLRDPDGIRVELVEERRWDTEERARAIAEYWRQRDAPRHDSEKARPRTT